MIKIGIYIMLSLLELNGVRIEAEKIEAENDEVAALGAIPGCAPAVHFRFYAIRRKTEMADGCLPEWVSRAQVCCDARIIVISKVRNAIALPLSQILPFPYTPIM